MKYHGNIVWCCIFTQIVLRFPVRVIDVANVARGRSNNLIDDTKITVNKRATNRHINCAVHHTFKECKKGEYKATICKKRSKTIPLKCLIKFMGKKNKRRKNINATPDDTPGVAIV